MRRSVAAVVLLFFTVLPIACSENTPNEPDSPVTLSLDIVSGQGQVGATGSELPQPVRVQATGADAKGKTKPIESVLVNFVVVSGNGSVFAGSAETDRDGFAADYWTLGPEPGLNTLEVRSVDASGQKSVWGTFEATGIETCTAGETQTQACGTNGIQTRTCSTGGTWGEWGNCLEGSPEVCNGLDDDLDGEIDEGDLCSAPNAQCACIGGECAIGSCDNGWGDCNGAYGDGCETDLNTASNCGACGATCPEGWTCVSGTCEPGPLGAIGVEPFELTSPTVGSTITFDLFGSGFTADGDTRVELHGATCNLSYNPAVLSVEYEHLYFEAQVAAETGVCDLQVSRQSDNSSVMLNEAITSTAGPSADLDGDGVSDAADLCPNGETGWTSDSSTDHDGDGCRDATEDLDDDSDGVPDTSDRCPRGMTGWTSDPDSPDDLDYDGCHDTGEDLEIVVFVGGTIQVDQLWKRGVTYRVTSDLYIHGPLSPVLTIEDGVTVEFSPLTGLHVGYSAPGELVAVGSSGGILFTSVRPTPSPGDWDGIWIGRYSQSTLFDGVTVEYGGGNGRGNILCDASSPTISNSGIYYSNFYGIFRQSGADPLLSNNDYFGNRSGPLY